MLPAYDKNGMINHWPGEAVFLTLDFAKWWQEVRAVGQGFLNILLKQI